MGSIQVENDIDLRKLIVYTQTRTSCQQKNTCKINVYRRSWWNWQTHHLEGVAGRPVRVRVSPTAPVPETIRKKWKRVFVFF